MILLSRIRGSAPTLDHRSHDTAGRSPEWKVSLIFDALRLPRTDKVFSGHSALLCGQIGRPRGSISRRAAYIPRPVSATNWGNVGTTVSHCMREAVANEKTVAVTSARRTVNRRRGSRMARTSKGSTVKGRYWVAAYMITLDERACGKSR